ncbi:alkaline phosphatase family protein [bacterium]|nr:alkaline phosphatase family protein [candidate division CSSED10-310 bacterium]
MKIDRLKDSGYPAGRLMIIGLDCAEPSLVFDRFRHLLPNLEKLSGSGYCGPLRSTDPPLTIPAWTSMFSGQDPGRLGLYGIRNRTGYNYSDLMISASGTVHVPRIWDYVSRRNEPSILVGIPQTYPIRPVNGCVVAGMLAPGTHSRFTHPPALKLEIESVAGGYEIDIPNFRQVSPEELAERIWTMTRKRFRVFRHLIKTREWRLAICVEIGLDRLHHAFWHYWDTNHPLHFPGNRFQSFMPDYYSLLDREIAGVLQSTPEDTAVFVVSDHGAQPMMGGVRINQWLMNRGYLTLRLQPPPESDLQMDWIDWDRTLAWGEGGYYGRVFLNVKEREPRGIIPRSDAERICSELAREFENMTGPDGNLLKNRVIIPRLHYRQIRGYPPDLMVYFGNLAWRSLGEIGVPDIFTRQNNRGPDGANHAQYGVLISNLPLKPENDSGGFQITDLMSVFCEILNIRLPNDAFPEPAGNGNGQD